MVRVRPVCRTCSSLNGGAAGLWASADGCRVARAVGLAADVAADVADPFRRSANVGLPLEGLNDAATAGAEVGPDGLRDNSRPLEACSSPVGRTAKAIGLCIGLSRCATILSGVGVLRTEAPPTRVGVDGLRVNEACTPSGVGVLRAMVACCRLSGSVPDWPTSGVSVLRAEAPPTRVGVDGLRVTTAVTNVG